MQKTAEILRNADSTLQDEWIADLQAGGWGDGGRYSETDWRNQASDFLKLLAAASQNGIPDLDGSGGTALRNHLETLSRTMAMRGATSAQTATFVFSLKKPIFSQLQKAIPGDATRLAEEMWAANGLIDRLGLHSVSRYQKSREDIINRQQEEMLELSTPVVKLWDGVLALPMIGTLDSARTQIVMESLLQRIVETGSTIAIIDITGVPTVDTLVAQHLLKTVTAIRLMGADCIISGIRPQIAQTIVHLGVNLEDVVTKATLADAFVVALGRVGAKITRS